MIPDDVPLGDTTARDIIPPVFTETDSSYTTAEIHLGNYESEGVYLSLNHVPVGATEAEIEAMLDTAELVYGRMKLRFKGAVLERGESDDTRR